MAVELAGQFQRVIDLEAHTACGQHAGIADLSAGFGIERGLVEQDDSLIARFDGIDRAAVLEQCDHRQAGSFKLFVAEEFGRLELRDQVRRQRGATGELAGCTRSLALFFHSGFEAGHVHGESALARDVGREVHGESVGVVQAEGINARDLATGTADDFLEDPHAAVQRLGEALFLGLEGTLDQFARSRQLGIGIAHQLDQQRHQLVEERTTHAQHPTMAQGAADDPAQHVAATFVGGQHAIDDQERTGADVIGDHAQ